VPDVGKRFFYVEPGPGSSGDFGVAEISCSFSDPARWFRSFSEQRLKDVAKELLRTILFVVAVSDASEVRLLYSLPR
jgi:hypothetical protein